MPEEEEVLEEDPSLEVLSDMQLRLATVAGGFAIVNEDEVNDGTDQFVSECRHRWEGLHGQKGEPEACGICKHHFQTVNICSMCRTKICTRCLNNRL